MSTSTEPVDYFSRNQECLDEKDRLTTKFETEISTLGKSSVEQIFYSPKLSTCLYVKYSAKEIQTGHFSKSLYDVRNDGPSSKPLEQCFGVSPLAIETRDFYLKQDGNLNEWNKAVKACELFDSKLEEYKT